MSTLLDIVSIKTELRNNGYEMFSNILDSLIIKMNNEIPTLCVTPMGEMLVNEEFFNKWNKKQKMFLIMHEVMHLVLKHLSRFPDKDHCRMNIANDIIVNELLDSGNIIHKEMLEKLDSGCFFDNSVAENTSLYNGILNKFYNHSVVNQTNFDDALKSQYLNLSTSGTLYDFLEQQSNKELLEMLKDMLNSQDEDESNQQEDSNQENNENNESNNSNNSNPSICKSKSKSKGKSSKSNKNSDKTDSNDSTSDSNESNTPEGQNENKGSTSQKNGIDLSKLDTSKMTDEEIRKAIEKIMEQVIGGSENTNGDQDNTMDGSLTEVKVKNAIKSSSKSDRSLDKIIDMAKQQAEDNMNDFCKGKGSLDSEPYELANIKSSEKINWVQLVKSNVLNSTVVERNYSFAKPNRRNFNLQQATGLNINLPSQSIQKSTPVVHFFVDTSGSVKDYELYCVLNEINEVFKTLKNMDLEIFFFDGCLNENSIKVKAGKSFKLKAQKISRGGTEFKNIWLHYYDNNGKARSGVKQPDVCVIITDGQDYGDYSMGGKMIGKKTIWVTNSQGWKAPNDKMKVVYRKF